MNNKTLHLYKAAMRDKNLNSIPHRLPDGTYQWSQGQLELLNEAQYSQLRMNNVEIDQLSARQKMLMRESLIYQQPSLKLEADGRNIVESLEPDIAEEELSLRGLKIDLKNFEEAILNRGLHFEDVQVHPDAKSTEQPKKSRESKVRSVLRFLLIWLVGEAYMTFISWKNLRDTNGIEDLLARSLSFGVILFLLHLVAHFNKATRRPVYSVFIVFALAMLLTMLFAPLAINKMYPDTSSDQASANQWSLIDDAKNEVSPVSDGSPMWVSVYRDNQTIPAILVFIFFVAMQSFLSAKKKQQVNEPLTTDAKPVTEHDEVNNRRKYMLGKISEGESRLSQMRLKQKEMLKHNTGSLQDILNKLEANKSQRLEIDKQIAAIKTASEILLSGLEARLNEYSIEFKDVLKSDEIKNTLVSPDWNTRQDIINYFKIYSI